jgi:two-component system, chemotaxis family, protein-glutamate methylesterase/glutaminase
MTAEYRLDRPISLTCPECGGAVKPERLGTLLQYRCHIGHVLTAETMLVAMLQEIETTLASCLRLLNEHMELCRQIVGQGSPDGKFKDALEMATAQAQERAETVRGMLEGEWVQPAEFWEKADP